MRKITKKSVTKNFTWKPSKTREVTLRVQIYYNERSQMDKIFIRYISITPSCTK